MTNEQRRNALNKARAEALRHATWAEELSTVGDDNSRPTWEQHVDLSSMWALVAQALKDGSPSRDSVEDYGEIR